MLLFSTSISYTFLPWLIFCLIPAIISGFLVHMLAVKKGYTGYFRTGFFLIFFGLVYVAGLPPIYEEEKKGTN